MSILIFQKSSFASLSLVLVMVMVVMGLGRWILLQVASVIQRLEDIECATSITSML